MIIRIILVLLGLIVISTVYHQIRKIIENKKCQPPGQMIKVGNSKMHIYGKGKGKPAILFTCGNGMGFSLGNYYPAFDKLAKKTRVLVYDRFGYGWSESTKSPRTIKQINEELHELINKSKEEGPFILVGHSLGATEIVSFAKKFPHLVAGVMTLDGTSPSFYRGRKELLKENMVVSKAARVLSITGLLRIMTNLKIVTTTNDTLPKDIAKITNMMTYNRVYSNEAVEEVKSLVNNNNDDDEKSTLGDIPILILTAENIDMKNKKEKLYQDFANSQNDLLKLSSNSQQKIIKDADHFFLIKKPDVVVEELENFLNVVQKKLSS